MPGSQRQHYISKSLIKRWAENDKVGVVCLHHRDSAEVSAKARTLHSVVDLWPQELEHSWHPAESQASDTVDRMEELLTSGGGDFEAMERMLSGPRNFASLIGLAVLHHARSLAVLIQQIADTRKGVANPDTAATIKKRWEDAQAYHHCGLVVTVLPPDEPMGLSAVPVFHTPHWGGPTPEAPVLFMMPLTPRIVISGVPEMETGEVHVVSEQIGDERAFTLALAGEPGLLSVPWVICKPSALDHTAGRVLSFCEGNPTHWMALYDRVGLHWEHVGSQRQAAWRRRINEHADRLGRHDDPTTSNTMRGRHRRAMAENAQALQVELDELEVPMCDCGSRRDKRADPDMAALWEQVMPKAICQEIRRKRTAAAR